MKRDRKLYTPPKSWHCWYGTSRWTQNPRQTARRKSAIHLSLCDRLDRFRRRAITLLTCGRGSTPRSRASIPRPLRRAPGSHEPTALSLPRCPPGRLSSPVSCNQDRRRHQRNHHGILGTASKTTYVFLKHSSATPYVANRLPTRLH